MRCLIPYSFRHPTFLLSCCVIERKSYLIPIAPFLCAVFLVARTILSDAITEKIMKLSRHCQRYFTVNSEWTNHSVTSQYSRYRNQDYYHPKPNNGYYCFWTIHSASPFTVCSTTTSPLLIIPSQYIGNVHPVIVRSVRRATQKGLYIQSSQWIIPYLL